MAQSGFTPIISYSSATASAVPLAANLAQGELALNTNDGRLFYKDSAGVVQTMASKATGSIGGSNTQVQFNSSGVLAGSASLTWSGTVLTSSGFAGPLNGTVGATTPNTGAFTTVSASGVATFSAGTVSLPAITTSGDTNTGIFFPAADTIAFTEGGVESMRIDASGNLGLGVTPAAWGSQYKVAQITRVGLYGATNYGYYGLLFNAYNDNTNNIYTSTNRAGEYRYDVTSGAHAWYNAPSGTAGNNVTFTQAMTLSAAGYLGIAETSPPNPLSIKSDGTATGNGWNEISSFRNAAQSKGLNIGYNPSANNATLVSQSGGSASGMEFWGYTGSAWAERMRIDSSGNLGLGVTPSAWFSGSKVLQINNAAFEGISDANITYANAYRDSSGSAWKYIASNLASRYIQTSGAHQWFNAPSGTAGNAITWTQAMTLDASGNLGLGVTSVTGGYKAQINGNLLLGTTANPAIVGTTSLNLYGDNSSSTGVRIDSSGNVGIGTTSPSTLVDLARSSTSGSDVSMPNLFVRNTSATQGNGSSTFNQVVIGASAGNGTVTGGIRAAYDSAGSYGTGMQFYVNSTNPLQFYTNGSERMRIDSSGNVGIGTSSPSVNANQTSLTINGTNNSRLDMYVGGASTAGFVVSSSASYLETRTSTPLVFNTNNTERMRINASGQLLVNATTDAAAAGARLHITSNTSQAACSVTAGTDGTPAWYFTNAAGTKVGDIVINSGGTAYNTTSDYRLKENIAPMTGALNIVTQLKPVTYKWKTDGSDGQGFIAHELQAVVPDCVTGEKDAVDAEGKPQYQGIDTSFLVATLTAAIQEQQALIQDLTTRLAALEAK